MEVSLPVYNPQHKYIRQIKAKLIHVCEAYIMLYKPALVHNIKQEYYRYLQATKSLGIYCNPHATVNGSLRVNAKLVKNNIATKEVVLKAKAQVSQLQISISEATQNQQNAAAYFNFRLNQPLKTAIQFDSAILYSLQQQIINTALTANREEHTKLKSVQKTLETNLKLNETFKLSTLSAFYDVGFRAMATNSMITSFISLWVCNLTGTFLKAT